MMNPLDRDDQTSSPPTEARSAEETRGGSVAPIPDRSRPFGVHLRLVWWKSLVLVAALPLTLAVTQLGLYLLAGLAEGDPFAQELTPLKLLAANLSTGFTAVVALVLVGRFARVPWRTVLSHPRRFDRRRLVVYFLGSLAIVGLGVALTGISAADTVGWTDFTVTGTTVVILVVVLLSTPVQTSGEEIVLRGAILPAVGSWFRSAKPAWIAGLIVSSLMFAVLHGSTDPALFAYLVFFSVCTAAMGLLTRGLEAAIAFHTANNLLTTTMNALFAGGGAIAVERSEGATGGFALLVPATASLAALLLVWRRERARPAAGRR